MTRLTDPETEAVVAATLALGEVLCVHGAVCVSHDDSGPLPTPTRGVTRGLLRRRVEL